MAFNTSNFMGNVARGIGNGRSVTTSLLSGALSAGVSGPLRNIMQGMMGGMTIPDVYITDLEHDNSLALSWIPEKISLKCGTKMQSYSIIERGDVKFPKGEQLTAVSWKAKLPGDKNLGAGYIKSSNWYKPDDILKVFKDWRSRGSKLHLLVTHTAINLDVYLDDYDAEYAGSQGDIDYSINFIAAKDLLVKTVEEVDAEKQQEKVEADQPILQPRPQMSPMTQAVVTGAMVASGSNNAWTVAQMAFGNGGLWPDVSSANGGMSDKLDAGTVLNIPGAVAY